MNRFSYTRAGTLAEGAGSGARPLAGGTDLLQRMKVRLQAPPALVDLTRVADAGVRDIAPQGDGGLRLGALVSLARIAEDAAVRADYTALAEAAAHSATPQLRNTATLGGNLCQWNRCWYLRGHVPCHLTGAAACPAARGDNRHHALYADGPCVAVHPSDPAVALAAFGALVEVVGPRGTREVPLDRFLHAPRPGSPEQAELGPGELVAAVRLPAGRAWTSTYEKATDRRTWAFALVSAAVALRAEGGSVTDAAVFLGGVAGVPHRADAVERHLRGRALTAEVAQEAAALAAEGAQPLAHNGYKVDLARAVVRAALSRLAAG